MQSLASYGSDSDESSAPSPPRSGPVASTSKHVQSHASLNPLAPARKFLALQLSRVKSSTTTTQSPASSKTNSPLLSGVLSTQHNSRSGTPTPRHKVDAAHAGTVNRNSASASPPTHARASAPRSTQNRLDDRNSQGNGTSSSTSHDGARSLDRDERTDPPRTEATARSAIDLNSLSRFGIPPIPTGPCNPAVEAKLSNFESLRQTRGLHFNDSLSNSKAFRNPRIYAKLVEFMDVDETGSCFDRNVWNSKEIGRDASASRLAELQKLRSEAKQAQVGQPSSRSSISFTSSSSSSTMTGKGGDMQSRYRERDNERERDRNRDKTGIKKSRWDNGAGSHQRDRSRSPARRR
ncbi:hypothetical protein JCM3766R1_001458 [Sporobolomyces carnicolor]